MFKLTIVGGPNTGTNFVLKEGENVLGRGSSNEVYLPSSRVSKNHCVVTVKGRTLELRDLGSANGTFINGVKARQKVIQAGDRISVGPFIFEVTRVKKNEKVSQYPVLAELQNGSLAARKDVGGTQAGYSNGGMPAAALSFWDRVNLYFEKYVMAFFYGLNIKYDWRWLGVGLFTGFLFLNLFFSVSPLLEANQQSVLIESGRRAQYMARQVAELNTAKFAAASQSGLTMAGTGEEFGVQVSVIADLQNRILAPADKLNQYLKSGTEARLAVAAANLFKEGRETGVVKDFQDELVVAIEPIRILDRKLGRNTTVAMVVVSIDATFATPRMGSIGVIYSKTLIVAVIFGALLALIFYRMTLKPLEILNEDMEKVLQGEMHQVTHDFKNESLDSLWTIINSALQRLPKTGSGGSSAEMDRESIEQTSFEVAVQAFRSMGDGARYGLLACDQARNVVFMNTVFEDISGIRSADAFGKELTSVARDQAFSVLVSNLFDAAQMSLGQALGEDFDFGGIVYEMRTVALGKDRAMGFILSATRKESAEA